MKTHRTWTILGVCKFCVPEQWHGTKPAQRASVHDSRYYHVQSVLDSMSHMYAGGSSLTLQGPVEEINP